jgi:hypothetical protein
MKIFQPAEPRREIPPLPDELQLQLAPGQAVQFTIPTAENYAAQWNITQLGNGSQILVGGTAEIITLALPPEAEPRSLIRGHIAIIRSADGAVIRSIPVAGWVRKSKIQTEPARQNWQFPRSGLKLKWLAPVILLIVALVAAAHFLFRPALVVTPARMDFGTLRYFPPVGGSVETSVIVTAEWRMVPHNAGNLFLVARTEYQYSGEKIGHGTEEETDTFPLAEKTTQAAIPLKSGKRNEDAIRISGTISLTVSNALASNTPVRLSLDHIPFSVEFRPAAAP